MSKDERSREKRWKNLYTRSVKLARAEQLGLEYPRITEQQLVQEATAANANSRINVLFVCSRNQWRSPTAEQVWRRHPLLNVRSGGTSPNARHTVNADDLRWSDVVIVMEQKHKSRLVAEFTRLLDNKPVHVLDIPDEYKYMDPELVELLEHSVGQLLSVD